MKKAIAGLAGLFAAFSLASGAFAQAGREPAARPPSFERVEAPADPAAIPLYGDTTPGTLSSEVWDRIGGADRIVRNVTMPTLTPVLPDPSKATGAAVVVVPGGGFMLLAMDKEGWAVAHALADRGIAAFVLKYRTVATPESEQAFNTFAQQKMHEEPSNPMNGWLLAHSKAPDDARAALAMVRAHASGWNVDPARVGIIGFSAGAITARSVTLAADVAARPAFTGYIYGPQDPAAALIPGDAPPLFDAIAFDDPLFPNKGFAIATQWHEAKRPVELHAYQAGSHGFGLGVPGTTTALVLDEFVAWLRMNGLLDAKPKD